MSQENVEVVGAIWAAYVSGDFQLALDGYAEDCVWDDTKDRPDGAVHIGREAIVRLATAWRGTWEDYEIAVEKLLDPGGDKVAAVLREKGRGKGGGVEVTNRFAHVETVRDGKIVHTMVYRDPREALEAVGLSE